MNILSVGEMRLKDSRFLKRSIEEEPEQDMLEHLTKLKIIQVQSVGENHLNQESIRANGRKFWSPFPKKSRNKPLIP